MNTELQEALDLQHEIKAQLRTHVEFEHATRLMAAVSEMVQTARKYAELEPMLEKAKEHGYDGWFSHSDPPDADNGDSGFWVPQDIWQEIAQIMKGQNDE